VSEAEADRAAPGEHLLSALHVQVSRQGGESMIDLTIHLRGEQPERRQFPVVPVVGSYIIGPGPERRLWQVSAVVHDDPIVNVYCVQVADRLAGELTTAWSAWSYYGNGPCTGDIEDCTCPTCARARMIAERFGPIGPQR